MKLTLTVCIWCAHEAAKWGMANRVAGADVIEKEACIALAVEIAGKHKIYSLAGAGGCQRWASFSRLFCSSDFFRVLVLQCCDIKRACVRACMVSLVYKQSAEGFNDGTSVNVHDIGVIWRQEDNARY